MVRSYEELFGELEELFPLEGRQGRELLEALGLAADRIHRIGAEALPVGPDLLGRVTARQLEIPSSEPGGAEQVIAAGTFLQPHHLDLLAGIEDDGIWVRRACHVPLLVAARGGSAGFLQDMLQRDLAGWPVELEGLAAGNPEQVLRALAHGVTRRLVCILADEESREAVLDDTRRLGARTLVGGLTSRPGSRTVVLERRDTLILVLSTETAAELLVHRAFITRLLGALLGVPTPLLHRLRTTRGLPMTEDTGLLIPARLVSQRRDGSVVPLGRPGAPSMDDLLGAQCALYLPPHSLPAEPDTEVQVLSLGPAQTLPPIHPGAVRETDE